MTGADEATCRAKITGTSMDGGWYYAACTCGWKEGTNAHQSASGAYSAWRLHVEPEEMRYDA